MISFIHIPCKWWISTIINLFLQSGRLIQVKARLAWLRCNSKPEVILYGWVWCSCARNTHALASWFAGGAQIKARDVHVQVLPNYGLCNMGSRVWVTGAECQHWGDGWRSVQSYASTGGFHNNKRALVDSNPMGRGGRRLVPVVPIMV